MVTTSGINRISLQGLGGARTAPNTSFAGPQLVSYLTLNHIQAEPRQTLAIERKLTRIAAGELMFAPHLMGQARENIQTLTQHDHLGNFASEAVSVLTIDILDQAATNPDLHQAAQEIVVQISQAALDLPNQRMEDALEAISALKSIPGFDTSIIENAENKLLQQLGRLPDQELASATPPAPTTPPVQQQEIQDVNIVVEKEATAAPETFTIKVANGNGGSVYIFQTFYPHTDYRPLVADSLKFSDLDKMDLDRGNLETSLGTMWCALSALGSRKGHVNGWLTNIRNEVNSVLTTQSQKIEVLRQARDLAIAFLTQAHQAKAERKAKIAQIESEDQREDEDDILDETLVDFGARLISMGELKKHANLSFSEKAIKLQSDFGEGIRQLKLGNGLEKMLHLKTTEKAETYFNGEISKLIVAGRTKITEIEERGNKAGLVAELIKIGENIDLANKHRRPTLVQLDSLRQIAAELDHRTVPIYKRLQAVPQIPEDEGAKRIAEEDLENWLRPPIANVSNQAEIEGLKAEISRLKTKLAAKEEAAEKQAIKVANLEERLKTAQNIFSRLIGNSPANQLIFEANGTEYKVDGKINGSKIIIADSWDWEVDGRKTTLTIIVADGPIAPPKEIAAGLRKGQEKSARLEEELAALKKEHEAVLQKVTAMEGAALRDSKQPLSKEHELFLILEKHKLTYEALYCLQEIKNEEQRQPVFDIAFTLARAGVDPGKFAYKCSCVFDDLSKSGKTFGINDLFMMIQLAKLILKNLPSSEWKDAMLLPVYYYNIKEGAPFLSDNFYNSSVKYLKQKINLAKLLKENINDALFIHITEVTKEEIKNKKLTPEQKEKIQKVGGALWSLLNFGIPLRDLKGVEIDFKRLMLGRENKGGTENGSN